MNASKSKLLILISVFFFWGFVAASNTILIPVFKQHFNLLQWQSQLVDFAFYAAYFIGSLVYFTLSYFKGDPLNKMGYKKGLILGLVISAIGAFGFIPAASEQSFFLMLLSLFIVGLGFALQQIVANPYVIAIGKPESGAHRISLAGGINSFGTTIGPLLIAYAIFGNLKIDSSVLENLDSVKLPYFILGLSFLAFATLLGFSNLPSITNEAHTEKNLGAFKFPQLTLGMLAIFAYVGVEVSIQSNLPALMKLPNILNLDHTKSVHFISLFWGSLMIGRWTASIGVFNLKTSTQKIVTVILPFAAFAVLILVNYIKGSPIADFVWYTPFVGLLLLVYLFGKNQPAKTLLLFSFVGALLMILGLISSGPFALYCFVAGGLFCSIMWPCIFSLSIAGLGKYTNQGSSLLIMMILGGAIIPPIQGYMGDLYGIQNSYFVPVLCFAYLIFYSISVKKILIKQGIDFDKDMLK